ncbi:transcriptional regulator [Klebsiella grimontii]|uniref:Transcriptional regulator n=1 Tax=Klebsiella grimontii TaxID=2058152 RepID=A0A7H4P412_9ENTR|nr:transcriptional regulator [Klebsiella grimontii]
MKLTSAGQTLLASMRPLLEQLAATEAELTQQQAEPEGPLRLCLPNRDWPLAVCAAHGANSPCATRK